MKKSVLSIATLLWYFLSFTQDTEFGISSNGLIYPDSTVKKLKFIVDSLNLKFRVCELHKVYRAKAQAIGNYISLDMGDIKMARQDLEANIGFDEFVKKYPVTVVDTNLLVARFNYKNFDKQDVTLFSSVELGSHHNHDLSFRERLEQFKLPLKGKWILSYQKKTQYSDESVKAFYFITEFTDAALPEKYARLVQYADCMVDTSVEVFKENAKRTGVRYFVARGKSKIDDFINYVHVKTGKPEFSGKYTEANYDKYAEKLKAWDSSRFIKIDNLKQHDSEFNKFFRAALYEGLNGGTSNDEFEEYAGRYDSKKTALELKRSRIVIGGCSMDISPRVHAMSIAVLSAETVNWEVFLRSHLDIMNDNFQRASDGSYAWGERKTYIKELEVLDINVPDLLLGISLRIENPGEHHYYGSIDRLGRALSESEKRDYIEAKILEMIRDNQLDDYNRVLMFYLYLNYNYYLDDKKLQEKNLEKLKSAVSTMPGYIAGKIKFK